jgi:hypothetical protein
MPQEMESVTSAIDRLEHMLRDVSAKPLQGLIKGRAERRKNEEKQEQVRVLQAAMRGGETRELRRHFGGIQDASAATPALSQPPREEKSRGTEEAARPQPPPEPSSQSSPSTTRPRSLSPARCRRVALSLEKKRPLPFEESSVFAQLEPQRLARPAADPRTVARRRALSIVKMSTESSMTHLTAQEALALIEASSARVQGVVRGSWVRGRLERLLLRQQAFDVVGLPGRQSGAARVIQAVLLGGERGSPALAPTNPAASLPPSIYSNYFLVWY